MQILSITTRAARWAAATLAGATLAGCYVMPMYPTPGYPSSGSNTTVVVPAAAPGPVTFTARLYPANDLASPYGVIAAVVTNDLQGRGHFSTAIHGESFSGEATRVAGSSRDGVANGAGTRGSYLSCRYTMNTPTMGTGNCRLNNGATFTMHVGN